MMLLFFIPYLVSYTLASNIDITPLTKKIYVVEDYFYTKENSLFYVGEKEVTLIAATWSPETAKVLSEKIKEITKKPIANVINTNFHPDRAGGNSFFKSMGAKIFSTQKTYDLMESQWQRIIASVKKAFPDFPSLPLTLPDQTFPGDFKLENGNIQVLYFGPSHTEDGTFVYFPREKVLYGSCALKEKLGNIEDANLNEYANTLKKLKKLKFKTIVAGHYSPVHGRELIDQYISLLDSRPK